MAYIESEDYPSKRIYLHADTVSMDYIDVINIYFEHRTRRRLNANGERRFDRMVVAFGNESIGVDEFTPRYVDLAQGVRLVPYDTDHRPLINPVPLISRDEELSGRDLFDRSELTPGVEVDIDYQPEKTGFREIVTGGALSEQDKKDIANLILGAESYPIV